MALTVTARERGNVRRRRLPQNWREGSRVSSEGGTPSWGRGWMTEPMSQRLKLSKTADGISEHSTTTLCLSSRKHGWRKHFCSPQGTHNVVEETGLHVGRKAECESCYKKNSKYCQHTELLPEPSNCTSLGRVILIAICVTGAPTIVQGPGHGGRDNYRLSRRDGIWTGLWRSGRFCHVWAE